MIRQRRVGQPAMREGQPTERESPLQSQKLEGGGRTDSGSGGRTKCSGIWDRRVAYGLVRSGEGH